MRRILVESARRRQSQKRGGRLTRQDLSDTRAAASDERVNRALSEVQQLLAPPPALFRPSVLSRALRYGRRTTTGPTADSNAATTSSSLRS